MKRQSPELQSQVSQIKSIEATEGWVSEHEVGTTIYSDTGTFMVSDISNMKKELTTIRDRCKDLEERSRHSNIRIPGVKEGWEHGKCPYQFVASLLFGSRETTDHRPGTLRSKPTQDNLPPQAFVVKCHYFSKKESRLKKAIEIKSVTTADRDHIWILPDSGHD